MTNTQVDILKVVGAATWNNNNDKPKIKYPNYASTHAIGIKITPQSEK